MALATASPALLGLPIWEELCAESPLAGPALRLTLLSGQL